MAAEAETGGERTEEPSQKRLQDARDRGQLPRSRELTNFATMIGGSATLLAVGGALSARMSQMMRRGLAIDPQQLRNPDGMFSSLSEACMSALTVLVPVFGALITLVVLAALALGVVTRAAPQLNLFGIGFTVTLLCGFFVLIVGLDGIMAGVTSMINSALDAAADLVHAPAAGAH